MKRLLVILSALLPLLAAGASDKVVERSQRRTPDWIGGMQEGYIIVSSDAATLDVAQEKAMTKVREQVLSAIATTVRTSTTITLREVTDNGVINSHRELNTSLSLEAADIPYLANISPSHAEAYYWTKIRRKDKSTYYTYYVKYPLSTSQLRLLVEEYEGRQKALNDSLQAFAATDMAVYTDLDDMLARLNQLKLFSASLREDDGRRDICRSVRLAYERMLFNNLHAGVLETTRDSSRVALFYGDHQLTCHLQPKVKTNCLTAVQTQNEGNAYLVTYDFSTGCYDDEQNWLDITYTVLGKHFSARSYVK